MTNVAYAVVASGGQISGAFGLSNARDVTVWCPVVDSCALLLRTSFDQTSANFVPFSDPGSRNATLSIAVAAGSKMVPLGPPSIPFAKVELSVAQTDNRTLAIITR